MLQYQVGSLPASTYLLTYQRNWQVPGTLVPSTKRIHITCSYLRTRAAWQVSWVGNTKLNKWATPSPSAASGHHQHDFDLEPSREQTTPNLRRRVESSQPTAVVTMSSDLAPTFAPFIGMVSFPNIILQEVAPILISCKGCIAAAMIFGCTSDPAPLCIDFDTLR